MVFETNVLDRAPSLPQLPLDVILTIIEQIPLPSAIGFENWDSKYQNILLIDRAIYSAIVARLYHTVVLHASAMIEGFLGTLGSSPHLGPLVCNLWISHKTIKSKGRGADLSARYAATTQALATVALTPNLRRLAIGSPLYYGTMHLSTVVLPSTLVDLVVPSWWVGMAPNSQGQSMPSHFPAGLRTLHMYGVVSEEEAKAIAVYCPTIRHVLVRVFGTGQYVQVELEKFTSTLLEELEELLSLEVMVSTNKDADTLTSWDALGKQWVAGDNRVGLNVDDDHDKREIHRWLNRDEPCSPA